MDFSSLLRLVCSYSCVLARKEQSLFSPPVTPRIAIQVTHSTRQMSAAALPYDVWMCIFSHCTLAQRLPFARVCKEWHEAVQDSYVLPVVMVGCAGRRAAHVSRRMLGCNGCALWTFANCRTYDWIPSSRCVSAWVRW